MTGQFRGIDPGQPDARPLAALERIAVNHIGHVTYEHGRHRNKEFIKASSEPGMSMIVRHLQSKDGGDGV